MYTLSMLLYALLMAAVSTGHQHEAYREPSNMSTVIDRQRQEPRICNKHALVCMNMHDTGWNRQTTASYQQAKTTASYRSAIAEVPMAKVPCASVHVWRSRSALQLTSVRVLLLDPNSQSNLPHIPATSAAPHDPPRLAVPPETVAALPRRPG